MQNTETVSSSRDVLFVPFTDTVTIQDVVGLLELLWHSIVRFLQALSPEEKQWVKTHRTYHALADVKTMPESDPRRLVAMDHKIIGKLLHNSRKNKVRIAHDFYVMEDLCFLSRSSSSVLPNADPNSPPVRLRDLTKKHFVRTVAPTRKDREEAEYQLFHLEAARYALHYPKSKVISEADHTKRLHTGNEGPNRQAATQRASPTWAYQCRVPSRDTFQASEDGQLLGDLGQAECLDHRQREEYLCPSNSELERERSRRSGCNKGNMETR